MNKVLLLQHNHLLHLQHPDSFREWLPAVLRPVERRRMWREPGLGEPTVLLNSHLSLQLAQNGAKIF